MVLKIGNRVIEKYSQVSVSLRYDSVASVFSFLVYFDPGDPQDRQTFIPGNYLTATISYNGEILITGVAISNKFGSSALKKLTSIAGYSKSGVIEDCQREPKYQTQYLQAPTIRQICESLLKNFGLKVAVDDSVKSLCDSVISSQTIEKDRTVKEIITALCISKNIVLSHDAMGNLLLTRADTTKKPIFNFKRDVNCLDIDLTFDGQQLHDPVYSIGQANTDTDNASESSIRNPYVQSHTELLQSNTQFAANPTYLGLAVYQTGYRPKVSIQAVGNDNNTALTARQVLAQELKSIRLTIKIHGWELNGKIVRPNNIVTVVDPENFLYQPTRWFIESVDFSGDEKSDTAILNCVLPECYNSDNVVNVFTGSNLTVAYSEPGAKATITPIDQSSILQ